MGFVLIHGLGSFYKLQQEQFDISLISKKQQ
jgi:hypothetical protein